jgi:hypothetical protein
MRDWLTVPLFPLILHAAMQICYDQCKIYFSASFSLPHWSLEQHSTRLINEKGGSSVRLRMVIIPLLSAHVPIPSI